MTRHFLAGEAQGRFTQARIDAIRTIARVVDERRAAFVVVAGDVFEHNQVARQTVARTLEALASLTVPVLLLPGNHDPLDAGSVFRSRAFVDGCPEQVIVLDDAGVRPVPGVAGVEILAAPWTGKKPLEDLVGRALRNSPAPTAGAIRVVVGHGCVDSLSPDRDDPAVIRLADLEAALRDGRAHYVALGDRHSSTEVGSSTAVRYSGAPEPTDFDELRPGRVLVVDLEPVRATIVDEVEVGTWRFVDLRTELDGEPSVADLAARLAALPQKERTILRLALSGSLGIADSAMLDANLSTASEQFASLRRWERHDRLTIQPQQLDIAELGLGGYARQAWQQLAASAASDAADRDVARDALVLLHRLAAEQRR